MSCASGVCNLPVEPPAPMLSNRAGHALVTLADGRVLAVGGHNGTSSTQTAEIYDPVANRWQSVAPMTASFGSTYGVPRSDGRAAVSGNARTGTSNGTVEVYTPATNTWARLPGAVASDRRAAHRRVPRSSTSIAPRSGMTDAGLGFVSPRTLH